MSHQRFAFHSNCLSDLTVGHYRNLLDLAQLAVSHPTTEALFPTLALNLRHSLNFDFVTLGLYNSNTESIRVDTWKAGEAHKRFESIPVHTCANGWAWKNQRSVLLQDLDAEPKLPVSLQSLRDLGVHTYYVFPLTTRHRQLGAIGFGSLHVIPETSATRELLRRTAAIIAQFLDTTVLRDGPIAQTECLQATSIAASEPDQALPDIDLGDPASRDEAFHEIVGNSAPVQELLRQVRRVAATDATVLLLGETGTGKGLVARAIHRLSPRADGEFVSVNCTAIPTELLESELFGHEKGAFTGAVNRRAGRLEVADGGTLLLDEIGDLPGVIQPKLLRVLQDKEFERLGSNKTVKVSVRVIAATNKDLERSIEEGRFRKDLYYRLSVFPIQIPPLRARKGDIPALVHHFVSKYATETKKSIETVPTDAMDAFVNWSWPGNIRELQNMVHRCVILTESRALRVPLVGLRSGTKLSSGKMSQEAERSLIIQALKDAGGVIGGASGVASSLGIKRTTLYSKLKKLNISRVDFLAT